MTGQVITQDVDVRPLIEADLPQADRVMRLAFGTFLGLPDPMAFMGSGDYVRSRWRADPAAALAAEADSRVVGTNFATQWGSVGFFAPLTVHPSLWDRGIGRRLLARTMEIMDGWGLSHAGLFTFGHSPKHIALYQAFGFLPRFLTAVWWPPLTGVEATADALAGLPPVVVVIVATVVMMMAPVVVVTVVVAVAVTVVVTVAVTTKEATSEDIRD